MSSAAPETAASAAATNAAQVTTTTTSPTPATTTAPAAATTTSSVTSSILSSLTSSTSGEPSASDAASTSSASSLSESRTSSLSPVASGDSNPAPIQSSKTDEHLARNICLGVFLLFAVVALIGLAYWGVPRLMRRRRVRREAKERELPFSNDDTTNNYTAVQHRSAMLMPGRNSSVSFDSRSPAEKTKSTGASPASLAFSPPISPKSPAPWAGHSHSNSTSTSLVPAVAGSAAMLVPPQRPAIRPPPLELEDVPRSVFYNHAYPSTTTIGSYPYEDEDSSHWAYVAPLSPYAAARPSSPSAAHVPDTARRDSDTYPRTHYL